MPVAMMNIRIMRVAVHQRRVLVGVAVRFIALRWRIVLMSMMFVVHVAVGVRQRFVRVSVRMALGQMQPYPERHAAARDPEKRTGRFAQQPQREHRANERRDGKIRAGACAAQMPQRQDKQHQAHAIT